MRDPVLFRFAGFGAALVGSDDKLESGCLSQAVADKIIKEHTDRCVFRKRTVITCARCGGHLRHVFPTAPNIRNDGPSLIEDWEEPAEESGVTGGAGAVGAVGGAGGAGGGEVVEQQLFGEEPAG